MDLKQYLQTAYKHRWLLSIGILLGLLAGAYGIASTETTYRGGVTFFVSTTGEGTASSANVGDQFALRRVNSYVALLSTDRLARMIIDDIGLDTTPGQLRGRISGGGDVNTVLLRANVRHENREQAFAIAESLSRQFPELVSEVEQPQAGESSVRLEVVSGPGVGVVPVRTKVLMASRILAGLALAAVIAFVLELMDNRLNSTDQMLAMGNAPLLGLIGHDKRASQAPLILEENSRTMRAESYRQLRTNLQFIDREAPAQVIVVTSSVPGEGKTTTAANLAIALAQSGQRVLLVDSDLRKPSLGELFSVEHAVGFTDVLLGRAELDDAVQPWGTSSLVILPSGEIPPNPAELLGTVATRRLLDELRLRFDTIVIDTPPLLPVTDAAVMSTIADGVVMLVHLEKVTRNQFQRALDLLERVDARLLGFVGSMLPERETEVYGTYGRDDQPVARSVDREAEYVAEAPRGRAPTERAPRRIGRSR